MKKKIYISVVIPAFNEQKNICGILRDVLNQAEHGFEIKEVIVISDGSTDRTVEYARQMVSKKIRVIAAKRRLGKSARLNQIFKIFKGEVLVLLDADVKLRSNRILSNLIKPFDRNKRVGLVSGVAFPEKGRTLIEEAVNLSVDTYLKYVDKLNKGETIYAVTGRILGLSRRFAKSANIPSNTYANDAYLYFLAKTSGFKFVHAKSASVSYRSPSNIVDQYKQNIRFVASQQKMQKFFGKSVISEYNVRKFLLYRLMFEQFLRKPLHSLLIFLVNFYCKVRAKSTAGRITARWDIAGSTKGGLNV